MPMSILHQSAVYQLQAKNLAKKRPLPTHPQQTLHAVLIRQSLHLSHSAFFLKRKLLVGDKRLVSKSVDLPQGFAFTNYII